MTSSKSHYKEKIARRREEKSEEIDNPKYRDRAKERRENQNPDYDPSELGSFHAVAPPGAVDLRAADALKLSIENSKYLGGDVEHTHLVKGLDYALLNKVRSEIVKKPDGEDDDGKTSAPKEVQRVTFRTAAAKSVYQWIVKPQTIIKSNEMFLPGRMTFVYDMEGGYTHDIPTTLYRSKADCPVPEELVTVNVDGSVLDRIAKIMSYLRLGSSGKVLKKKKKEKESKGKTSTIANYDEDNNQSKIENGSSVNISEREDLPPPPPLPPVINHLDLSKKQEEPPVARTDDDDIFVGEGIDYTVPGKDVMQSPISEDMEESPRDKERVPYFTEPAYGPVQPSAGQEWQDMSVYGPMQTQGLAAGYPEEWQDYQYAEQIGYQDQYLPPGMEGYDVQPETDILQDPQLMSQEEKDRGLGSVFKRDDQRLQQLRESDAREKDPTFVSENYSECYPGYQEYNHEVVGSDEEADLSKMDMGGKAKGGLHRWDFETEEEWEKYNEQKEAMPKAAFQFGVKMQDGRKTRKQNRDRDQKLNNELHKINKILTRKKMEKEGGDVASLDAVDVQTPKRSKH
ncbi:PREDICTED: suppressor of mec-8 and unc-52 protein homolog 2 [Camelina sativa]|uniref:Suppressor of mec-8 and unc-52 protein homolog 2 n=1 Tax=Camelina sativa TaxID=90675 RepID=A0ABM0SX80_CAMSA|nr:PREDICTED: suppressor of mec-8 and unc-52 protein homolog 2 [Camelina sativa]